MTRTINRLLVANRGEIARRVFATCRRLGIETVAVHSDADAGLPFVSEADLAVRLPGDAPADTYLRADLVLDAARRTGADAIHPGYGFLSENADFARAVIAAGLTWVGPAPESIITMGSKVASKELMETAGVPVLSNLTVDSATEADLPLLVKASAGGGGRGMRVVHQLVDLPVEIESAAAEAASAFGDGTVFVEPYVENSRHVEVQVIGDPGGFVAILGERDCTVQRRHQKVVEEAPAPGLSGEVRKALHEAARKAAEAIDYLGPGTVEFLVDAADPSRFYFLEMNTRLQVEHPVTECVTGLDLVELQLAVAEGRSPEMTVTEVRGHAIEVRLYAEDPAAGYQPQSGSLSLVEVPHVVEFDLPARHGVRLDTGFASGSEVSTHYDAMLAKVISWGATRETAIRQLVGALRTARLHGVRTNRDQLVEILQHPDFAAMEVSTSWLEAGLSGGPATGSADETVAHAPPEAVAAALALAEDSVVRRRVQRDVPVAWRNVVSQPQRTVFEADGEEIAVQWLGGRDGYVVDGVEVLSVSPTEVRLVVNGIAATYRVTQTHGQKSPGVGSAPRELWVDGPHVSARLREVPRFTDPTDQVASGSLLAPMPGTVVRVAVEAGAQVATGEAVLVLEAMKMQHTVTAPHAGTVTEVRVVPGTQVASGEVLAVVAPEEGPEAESQEEGES